MVFLDAELACDLGDRNAIYRINRWLITARYSRPLVSTNETFISKIQVRHKGVKGPSNDSKTDQSCTIDVYTINCHLTGSPSFNMIRLF